jgi:hypothetical protein
LAIFARAAASSDASTTTKLREVVALPPCSIQRSWRQTSESERPSSPFNRPGARTPAVQRKEPADAAGRTSGQRHQADIQPGSQCRHECQQWAGQLTTVLLLRDRGPRTTGPLWPDGLESTPSRRWHLSGRAAAPLRKQSFADQAKKSAPMHSGRSRVVIIDRQTILAERLHPKATNWCCRPVAVRGRFRDERPIYRMRPANAS